MVSEFGSASTETVEQGLSSPLVHIASPAGSLPPTEPPTPDSFLHPPIIRGNKPIPYIVQLHDGGCEHKFPVDADFNNRSQPPTHPLMPKSRHRPMPLRKEESKIRRPNLVLPTDVEVVYSKENMRAVTVWDFWFSKGKERGATLSLGE
ncbi:hypothetical protein BT69DRAFT_1343777 [Atractiella rhizophila]|nr:hypothetical protein BT69DRAFT_1343777 [Atractiella rhizophila]